MTTQGHPESPSATTEPSSPRLPVPGKGPRYATIGLIRAAANQLDTTSPTWSPSSPITNTLISPEGSSQSWTRCRAGVGAPAGPVDGDRVGAG